MDTCEQSSHAAQWSFFQEFDFCSLIRRQNSANPIRLHTAEHHTTKRGTHPKVFECLAMMPPHRMQERGQEFEPIRDQRQIPECGAADFNRQPIANRA